MREILFRGKRKVNDEWVHGFLFVSRKGEYKIKWYDPKHGLARTSEVYPQTVGQFTGLTDKNGKKIFEGDIVRDDYESGTHASIVWLPQGCGWYLSYSRTDRRMGHRSRGCGYTQDEFLEVIGNIHDNPELLGGADND